MRALHGRRTPSRSGSQCSIHSMQFSYSSPPDYGSILERNCPRTSKSGCICVYSYTFRKGASQRNSQIQFLAFFFAEFRNVRENKSAHECTCEDIIAKGRNWALGKLVEASSIETCCQSRVATPRFRSNRKLSPETVSIFDVDGAILWTRGKPLDLAMRYDMPCLDQRRSIRVITL